MIKVVPADPMHLHRIVPQESQRGGFDPFGLAKYTGEAKGRSWAALAEQDGRVLFVGGFLEVFPHYAYCWAIIAADVGRAIVPITYEVAAQIHSAPYERVDFYVDADQERAVAWAYRLGMEMESIMPRAAANGSAMLRFVRLREAQDDG